MFLAYQVLYLLLHGRLTRYIRTKKTSKSYIHKSQDLWKPLGNYGNMTKGYYQYTLELKKKSGK